MSPKTAFSLFKWLLGAVQIKSTILRHVLIVDDVSNDLEQMAVVAQNEGYIVHTATTLSGALIKLRERKWEKVLLDLNLGNPVKRMTASGETTVMEGTIFAEEAVKAEPDIKIVVVTGSAVSADNSNATRQFPCILKGSSFYQFEKSLSAVLANGSGDKSDVKLFRFFIFWLVTCSLIYVAGYATSHFKWITI